jgi:hypothetical protein
MKRSVLIGVLAIMLLLLLTVMVSGERVDTKTAAKAATPVHVAEPALSGEDVHQPQAIAPFTAEAAMEPGAYAIPWQSINAGGDNLSSTNYQMMFSVGQSVIGYATSTNYEAGIGYWYGAGGAEDCDCGLKGDVNHDGGTTPLDVQFLVKYVYQSLDALYLYENCPWGKGDVNCDGNTTPLDVQFLVKFVYKGQDALCVQCP